MTKAHGKHKTVLHNYGVVLFLLGGISFAQQPGVSKASSQLVLNALATPLEPNSFKPPLPPNYAAWSNEQRADAPRQIAGRCRTAWVMMNDHSRIQLLPTNQNAEDTPRLIMGVCALGKMPQDWPGRPQQLTDVKRILRRSSELGSPLVLPSLLSR